MIVYAEPGYYAGWPANHGAWQRGDEFLVGFMRGPFDRDGAMHRIGQPFEKLLARSHDGGETWAVERPNVDFSGQIPLIRHGGRLGNVLLRFCGVYDTGGEDCAPEGAFYASSSFGQLWHGPYPITGLESLLGEEFQFTARTCVLGNLVFLSRGQRDIWGTDETFVARFDGVRFEFVSTVCADSARAVMPSVAEAGDRIVCALRRRKTGRRACWIDVFSSDDGGFTWNPLAFVGDTGSHNGNPPALVALPGGRLVCAYGNRDYGEMRYCTSDDHGATWSFPLVFRHGGSSDIGYPQLFVRSDGVPVCVYYWADKERPLQHIEASVIQI